MKKLVLIAAVIAATTCCAVSALADNIGVVDMKTIFTTSPKVKAIKAELTKQFDPQKTKLEGMAKTLQDNVQKFQKNKTVMSKADLSTLQNTIATEESNFRDAQNQFQEDIMKAQTDRLKQLMDSVKSAVATVAQKEKLDLVIPSNNTLYIKNGMDITSQVLKNLDK